MESARYKWVLCPVGFVCLLLFLLVQIRTADAYNPRIEEKGGVGCDAIFLAEKKILRKYKNRFRVRIRSSHWWFHKPGRVPFFEKMSKTTYDFHSYRLPTYRHKKLVNKVKFHYKERRPVKITGELKIRVYQKSKPNKYADIHLWFEQRAGFKMNITKAVFTNKTGEKLKYKTYTNVFGGPQKEALADVVEQGQSWGSSIGEYNPGEPPK